MSLIPPIAQFPLNLLNTLPALQGYVKTYSIKVPHTRFSREHVVEYWIHWFHLVVLVSPIAFIYEIKETVLTWCLRRSQTDHARLGEGIYIGQDKIFKGKYGIHG